ncbi:DUF6612 family protein [Actinophytocola xanthii]|uniref:LppX_LprAFG lipoprotein n=1 Tax=Actinophytocola xanthii TaxID=1912961 RepID=A0A1Q8CWX7_9PSEU|nr:DUF6612 family protein [Actinophytocola xanthii]OLF18860.1 hypothetical protein BU204_03075 [Actinophytocola xanthii]
MRKLTGVLSAFALAVTLSACGNEADSGDAGTNNGGGGSEQAATNLAALAKSISDSTADTNTAHMVIDVDAGGQKVTGEGDIELGSADPKMTMTMSTPDGDMEMVFVDGVLYIKTPEELEPGKPWLKIDSQGNDPMSKALAGMTDQMREQADPRATLEQFKNSGTVTSQKEEELNGEQTTHYTIKVDAKKLAAEQSDPAAKSALEQAGVKEFPVELWVNEDDLPVQVQVKMPVKDPASGATTQTSAKVTYSKWGEPVEIAAPSADQIGKMPGS